MAAITDTFIRANNTNISTGAPNPLTEVVGDAEILSNYLHPVTQGVEIRVRIQADLGSVDHQWSVTIKALTFDGPGDISAGVCARYDPSTDTCYLLVLDGTTNGALTGYLFAISAGSYVQIAVSANNLSLAINDVLKLECNGTAIKGYKNGVLIPGLSVTDATITTGVRGGADAYWDSAANIGLGPLTGDVLSAPVAPTITIASPPGGTVGSSYSYQFGATGSTPITWSLNSGTLPAGLSLSAGGLLSGTPTTAIAYAFTVKASNGTAPDATSGTLNVLIVAAGIGGGTPPATPPDVAVGVPASRIVAWNALGTYSWDTSQLSDATLDDYHNNRHIGGAVMIIGLLYGYGGDKAFTNASSPNFAGDGRTGSQWAWHKTLKQNLVGGKTLRQRFTDRGMKMYLGFHLFDYNNTVDADFLPHDPFDDTWWNAWCGNAIDGQGPVQLVAAAKNLGFDGIAIDHEPTQGGVGVQQWVWNYNGNTHTEAQVRAKVKARGAQIGAALWAAAAGAELVVYFPTSQDLRHGIEEDYNCVFNNDGGSYGNGSCLALNCVDEFFDGMLSQPGHGNFYAARSIFYKNQNLNGPPGHTWEGDLAYDINQTCARLSREWGNPANVMPFLQVDPFTWLDGGLNTGEGALDPTTANSDLVSNNRWGMGGTFVLYEQHFDDGTSYVSWYTALSNGSNTASIGSHAPTISAVPLSGRSGNMITLTFTATDVDGYGIAYIDYKVYAADGTTLLLSSVFGHTWVIDSGGVPSPPIVGHAAVAQSIVAATTSFVVVTAHTLHGQTHSLVVPMENAGAVPPPPPPLPPPPPGQPPAQMPAQIVGISLSASQLRSLTDSVNSVVPLTATQRTAIVKVLAARLSTMRTN